MVKERWGEGNREIVCLFWFFGSIYLVLIFDDSVLSYYLNSVCLVMIY